MWQLKPCRNNSSRRTRRPADAPRVRQVLRGRGGETIVEVLVSFVMLLIFAGLFNGCIGFAQSMMGRVNARRDALYLAQAALAQGSAAAPVQDPDGEAVYRFSGAGEFTVTAQPGTVTVTVGGGEAEQTLTFRQFIPPQEGGGGS